MSKKSLIKKSRLERLDSLTNQFNFLEKTIEEYTLLKNKIENNIINLLEAENKNKHKNVRLDNININKKLSIKEIKEHFNNENTKFLDSIIVSIDFESSLKSIRYDLNLQKPIEEAFRLKLEDISRTKATRLVVDKVVSDE